MVNNHWLVVWNMTFMTFHILGMIYNPNWRTPSFFRGVAQPPTRSPAPNNAFPFVILSSGLWGSIAAHVGDHGLYISMIAFIPMLLNIAQHLCLMNCIQGFLASIPFALNRNYLFLLLTPSFNSIFYLFKHITIFSLLIHPHVFTISHVRLMDWWLNILYHDSYHTHFWWIDGWKPPIMIYITTMTYYDWWILSCHATYHVFSWSILKY